MSLINRILNITLGEGTMRSGANFMRILLVILLSVITVHATPVTINEFLNQDPKQQPSITIIETEECCEDDNGFLWWPFLFVGVIPLAFIDDKNRPQVILPPVGTPTPTAPPEPIPEPLSILLFGSGMVAIIWRLRR